jgi:hypothetical protein
MGDQHALVAGFHRDVGLDQVTAAAHVGRDLGRDMADALVEDELAAMVGARGILGEAWTKAIIERQHLVGLGLLPPFGDHRLQPLRLLLRKIVRFGEITIEMIKLPRVILEL